VSSTRNGTGGNVAGSVHLVVTRSVAGGPVTTMLDYTWANGVVGRLRRQAPSPMTGSLMKSP
jgi:hypothetical protein